ncbi:MAG TPA: hypothetical protein VFH63_00995 [candidate division Zixibacteria bacterium]|nr:hypothetical protein [candidate division Zixibacteria bacterium]
MAGTMPHAIFVETNADGAGGAVAYAAELPGCAVFDDDPDAAAAAMPRRVERFTAWLRERGEPMPAFLGDNWYEVERAAAVGGPDGLRRASFSLDDLPPSEEEFERWIIWLELAREEVAEALDRFSDPPAELLDAVSTQDAALARELGGDPGSLPAHPVDRLYAARDALTDALHVAGPNADGVRRALRLAIADDLRLAERLTELAR